jgi:hypothetical protein
MEKGKTARQKTTDSLTEGAANVDNYGINPKPTTQRPPPPKGQGGTASSPPPPKGRDGK